MNEYVENVVVDSTTNGNGDLITIPRSEYNQLKNEREEYRSIALEVREQYNAIKERFLVDGGDSL